jgi:hypothetical protein
VKEYISGYYCRDDLHLQVINKESNRRILRALKDVYPNGLTIFELAEVTDLPLKTIYAQKAELYREYYINHLDEKTTKRGRPTLHTTKEAESQRNRTRLVIEETSGVHDIYSGKKPIPLPPGNVVYSEGFLDAWHKIVTKEEEDELCISLLQFLQKLVNRITEYEDEETKMWAPEKKLERCCTQCGLHHEARDFMRATLLHLLDQLEKHAKFIDFLKDNNFLTQQAYERMKAKTEAKKK